MSRLTECLLFCPKLMEESVESHSPVSLQLSDLGIGCSVVKGLVERQEGSWYLTSEPSGWLYICDCTVCIIALASILWQTPFEGEGTYLPT